MSLPDINAMMGAPDPAEPGMGGDPAAPPIDPMADPEIAAFAKEDEALGVQSRARVGNQLLGPGVTPEDAQQLITAVQALGQATDTDYLTGAHPTAVDAAAVVGGLGPILAQSQDPALQGWAPKLDVGLLQTPEGVAELAANLYAAVQDEAFIAALNAPPPTTSPGGPVAQPAGDAAGGPPAPPPTLSMDSRPRRM